MYVWTQDSKKDPLNTVPPNPWDYIHIFTLVLARAVVIGVKYGSYSDESFQILRKLRIPDSLI